MSYKTTISTLGNGSKVTIRQPDEPGDSDRIFNFMSALPAPLRNYLRYNVTERKLFDSRMAQLDGNNHWRLIAEVDGEIMGDATMDREPFGWTRHVAALRAVVAPTSASLGLRVLLMHELVVIAQHAGIGRVFTEVLAEHTELISALARVGFESEAIRVRYAKDLKGKLHDVVVMSNDLENVWEQLQEMIHETDIRIERSLSGR